MNWTRDGLHWRTEDITIFPKFEEDYLVGYSWVRSGVFSDTIFYTAEEAKQDVECNCLTESARPEDEDRGRVRIL